MSANSRQEGGDHYKNLGARQHWDLVIEYGWDYFQSQITKYLMRWKTKHTTPEKRLEDLKKARHFLDKYIENFEVYDRREDEKVLAAVAQVGSNEHYTVEGYFGDMTNEYKCRRCGGMVRALACPTTPHNCKEQK